MAWFAKLCSCTSAEKQPSVIPEKEPLSTEDQSQDGQQPDQQKITNSLEHGTIILASKNRTSIPDLEEDSCTMQSKHLYKGTRILIQRSDGRVHPAMVSEVKWDSGSVTVEWLELGETKGKEIDLEQIKVMNPDLFPNENLNLAPVTYLDHRLTRCGTRASVPIRPSHVRAPLSNGHGVNHSLQAPDTQIPRNIGHTTTNVRTTRLQQQQQQQQQQLQQEQSI